MDPKMVDSATDKHVSKGDQSRDVPPSAIKQPQTNNPETDIQGLAQTKDSEDAPISDSEKDRLREE